MPETKLPTTAFTVAHGDKRHVVHVVKGDHIGRTLRTGSFYECRMLQAIAKYGRVGVYLDIGAHCGNHTVFFAEHCPSTRVVSVEPDPHTFWLLCKNTAMLSNVETIHAAVMDRGTRVRVKRPASSNTGMNYVEIDPDGDVEAVRADALVYPDETLAVVKIDVEGSETAVLRSLGDLLTEHDPLLFIEARTRSERGKHAEILHPLGYAIRATFNRTPTHLWARSTSQPLGS